VRALEAANAAVDRGVRDITVRADWTGQPATPVSENLSSPARARAYEPAFVFDYDATTVAELDALSDPPAGV